MRKTLMAASVLALMAGSASAASITYAPVTTGIVGAGGDLEFSDFDSALGTLTGISIAWTSAFTAEFEVIAALNPGDASGADDFAKNNVTMSGPTSGVPLGGFAGTAFDVSILHLASYTQDLVGSSSATETLGPLAAFIDTGDGLVHYSTAGTLSDTTTVESGLFRGVNDYLYEVTATVTYTYSTPTSDVPVPAALPLLATAFGALGLMRLRRKA